MADTVSVLEIADTSGVKYVAKLFIYLMALVSHL